MDECDLGARAADIFLNRALDQVRSGRPVGDSRMECIDCEEPIPERRRRAVPGCLRCVNCEAELERTHRR